jgi:hypothetical protein
LLADVSFAIIGIDFLKHFKFVVDAAAGQLIDTRTMVVIPAASGGDKWSAAASRGGLFCAVGAVPPAYRGLLVDQKAMEDRGLCYYHFTYADKATKCRKPCACSGN